MNSLSTAPTVLAGWADSLPEREFLLQPVNGEIRSLTFRDAHDEARRMAAALIELGLQPGDRVGILGKNCAEWLLADIAISMAGLVSVPIYPTASAETIRFILEHSEARAAFLGKLDEPDAIGQVLPNSIVTIAFPYPTVACGHDWQTLVGGTEPMTVTHQPGEPDVMTILYTSGSTGQPKGVVISYGAYGYACTAAGKVADCGTDDRILSYLPLAHVTERMAIVGPAIFAGARIFFVESLETFPRDIKKARPTAFGSVPRLWVKFQSGIHAKIPPARLNRLLALPVVGRVVARKIRGGLGLDACRLFGSGAAPISPHTLHWYRKLGINISEGWGMSETSGLSCTNTPFEARRIGTIGLPVEGTELRISDDGELLIRCPGLFTEYYKRPALTAESFDGEGFFHTGDKAEWDEGVGAYRITGRVKDIFKSAKGKYVTPAPIEALLSGDPLVEQVCVIGSALPAPVGVVVLSEAAGRMPREDVAESLAATLADVNEQLESHERVAGLFIARDEWTTENGLMTPTLKVKRDKIEAAYLPIVDRNFGSKVVWEDTDALN